MKTTTNNETMDRAMSMMISYGVAAEVATKIADLMSKALYVTINKHGFGVHGLLGNNKLFLLVWDDKTMQVGGQGNASSFTVSNLGL